MTEARGLGIGIFVVSGDIGTQWFGVDEITCNCSDGTTFAFLWDEDRWKIVSLMKGRLFDKIEKDVDVEGDITDILTFKDGLLWVRRV